MCIDRDWDRIDEALIRMRRLLDMPRSGEDAVDLSGVLVVDTIARRAAAGAGTRIADIAAHLTVKPSTASRLVSRAENAGLIRRSQSAEDPRSVILGLTPEGEDLNGAAKRFRIDFLRRTAPETWDAPTVATFARLLDEFSRGAGTLDASSPRTTN